MLLVLSVFVAFGVAVVVGGDVVVLCCCCCVDVVFNVVIYGVGLVGEVVDAMVVCVGYWS